MPKVVSELEKQNRVVRSIISANMEMFGLDDEAVATKLHVAKRTFQNKRKKPETFTLAELRKLTAVLKLSDNDRAMLLQ